MPPCCVKTRNSGCTKLQKPVSCRQPAGVQCCSIDDVTWTLTSSFSTPWWGHEPSTKRENNRGRCNYGGVVMSSSREPQCRPIFGTKLLFFQIPHNNNIVTITIGDRDELPAEYCFKMSHVYTFAFIILYNYFITRWLVSLCNVCLCSRINWIFYFYYKKQNFMIWEFTLVVKNLKRNKIQ